MGKTLVCISLIEANPSTDHCADPQAWDIWNKRRSSKRAPKNINSLKIYLKAGAELAYSSSQNDGMVLSANLKVLARSYH